MGSGIAAAGHLGTTRGPCKASKNTTGVVFEPFQRVLEHLGRSWIPSKHYFSRSKASWSSPGHSFCRSNAFWSPPEQFFDDPAPPGALQDTIFVDSTPPRASRTLILSIWGLLNLSRTQSCSSNASNMIVDAAKSERLKR